MQRVLQLARGMVRRSLERDRRSEPYVERASRWLWPWRESRLLIIVALFAVLDFASTYAALEMSRYGSLIYESGALAGWALGVGGFEGLFLFDVVAVTTLLMVAITVRFLFFQFRLKGFARATFVILLVPYIIATGFAITNNVLLALL